MHTLPMVILAVVLVSLTGLGGGLIPSRFLQKNISALLALASGALVATAFLELLPDALEHMTVLNAQPVLVACLLGFLVFYVVENFLDSHATGQKGHKHDHVGPLILLGDALHNITDGLAITVSFLTSVQLGVATTITVVLHELPQEMADYTILVARGWPRSKALLAVFIVQLTAFLGVAGAYGAATLSLNTTPYLLAFSAGGFIYIAAADLLPAIEKGGGRRGAVNRFLLFLTGIGFMAFLRLVIHE